MTCPAAVWSLVLAFLPYAVFGYVVAAVCIAAMVAHWRRERV